VLEIIIKFAVISFVDALPPGYSSRHMYIPFLHASKNDGVFGNKMFLEQMKVKLLPSPSYSSDSGEVFGSGGVPDNPDQTISLPNISEQKYSLTDPDSPPSETVPPDIVNDLNELESEFESESQSDSSQSRNKQISVGSLARNFPSFPTVSPSSLTYDSVSLPAAPRNRLSLGLESVPHNPFNFLEDVTTVTKEPILAVENMQTMVVSENRTLSDNVEEAGTELHPRILVHTDDETGSKIPDDDENSAHDESFLPKHLFHQELGSLTKTEPHLGVENDDVDREQPEDSGSKGPRVILKSQFPWHYGLKSDLSGCEEVEKVEWVTQCEDYQEETCTSQHKEVCEKQVFPNCTGVVTTEVERICYILNEQICKLEEIISYDTVEENFMVTKCTKIKERVCDTIFHTEVFSQDDFQCVDLESPSCYLEDMKVNETVCRHSVEFDCGRKKSQISDVYNAKDQECDQKPTTSCYDVPRTVHTEKCNIEEHKFCQKLSNRTPFPMESQNCHFETRKDCEVQNRVRPKKVKRLTYRPDCSVVPRQVCDNKEVKMLETSCADVERLRCSYVPESKCSKETKQFCHQVEQLVVEKTC